MTNRDDTERLAAGVGEQAGDLSDEHERWRIYRRAIDLPAAWADLLAAIASDPDPVMSGSAAIQLLERVPPEMRDTVVGVLAGRHEHDLATVRARELGILESLSSGRPDVGSLREDLDSWTNWLQLRVAAEVTDERVLAELAESGRTKRVRRTASERLRPPGSRAGSRRPAGQSVPGRRATPDTGPR